MAQAPGSLSAAAVSAAVAITLTHPLLLLLLSIDSGGQCQLLVSNRGGTV
jgi:hypothetical protein